MKKISIKDSIDFIQHGEHSDLHEVSLHCIFNKIALDYFLEKNSDDKEFIVSLYETMFELFLEQYCNHFNGYLLFPFSIGANNYNSYFKDFVPPLEKYASHDFIAIKAFSFLSDGIDENSVESQYYTNSSEYRTMRMNLDFSNPIFSDIKQKKDKFNHGIGEIMFFSNIAFFHLNEKIYEHLKTSKYFSFIEALKNKTYKESLINDFNDFYSFYMYTVYDLVTNHTTNENILSPFYNIMLHFIKLMNTQKSYGKFFNYFLNSYFQTLYGYYEFLKYKGCLRVDINKKFFNRIEIFISFLKIAHHKINEGIASNKYRKCSELFNLNHISNIPEKLSNLAINPNIMNDIRMNNVLLLKKICSFDNNIVKLQNADISLFSINKDYSEKLNNILKLYKKEK